MVRTKLPVRRLPADVYKMARGRRGKRTYPYKIKLTLPEQKDCKYEKEWQNN